MSTDMMYDKLTTDTSLKPTFNGLEPKEIKKSFSTPVAEETRRRVVILPSNPHAGTNVPDPCVAAPEATGLLPASPSGGPPVFISIKLAPTNPKGLQPVLIGTTTFVPQHEAATKAVKLEADAVTYYTTGNSSADAAFGVGVPTKLWVFNPNKDPVAVDVKVGFGPKPAASTSTGTGSAGGWGSGTGGAGTGPGTGGAGPGTGGTDNAT